MTQLNRFTRLLILIAAITALSVAFTGTASAASSDYSSPDGVCYTSGWCHWNEVCYDSFGGCYFDFWCPNGATSPGQCLYYGGFAPYATAASSASGPGTSNNASSSSSNTDTITGGSFTIGSGAAAASASGSTDTISGGSFDINHVVDGDIIGYDNGCGYFSCIVIGSTALNSSSDLSKSIDTLIGWNNPLIRGGLTAAYFAINPFR